MDSRDLKETFEEYGPIFSAKVMVSETGASKRYGYVQFERPEDACEAIKRADGTAMGAYRIHVEAFKSCEERGPQPKGPNCNNLYVKRIPKSVTNEEIFREMFLKFGDILSVHLPRVGRQLLHYCNFGVSGFAFLGWWVGGLFVVWLVVLCIGVPSWLLNHLMYVYI